MEQFSNASKIETEIYEALKTVIDPELAVNIVDLGLVYKIEASEEKGIEIDVTLSTKGCPMGDVIIGDIESTLKRNFPAMKQTINLVWEPAWCTDFVTPDGRQALGMAPESND